MSDQPVQSVRSTPLVTSGQARTFAGATVTEFRGWVEAGILTPVACAVRTRALLYPLAAVTRAQRDITRVRAMRRVNRRVA